ncbi:2-amino-4-hydroxy-6-hydroxymethyldihydropteridine diphosphokinase [Aliiglaciecola sp. CAU 1673]|uniref:2-amino-4-hydroxy-6- hydroxymethyldihydropteridine diphosphokinase n=1 Tax=Aliiglaciecola sp. CAU 1673 TaxID=3032595 RepID=UPI0023DB6B1F|nr:2-amino-4-hydroxy-6-hydroxymethyldihydropteridine diphosphokinase [Aliiglaciecola sp. CAU 1673]MDF2180064.1 2-amino-4-hydroxy-6-hydroxymethyldihydropteridine diphosphokinase [Aliiglaciecola sp. CAU 1673]
MAQIFISLGSNIEREQHTRAGLDALHIHFGPLTLSRLYESEAVGFNGRPFYNMVIAAHTHCSVEEVVALLKGIEQANGRQPSAKKFAPRTLDLDLLLYDEICCEQPVALPRGEILENAFVLWPLAEIAPQLKHPVVNQSYHSLWQAYNKESQKLWPLSFEWKPSAP